jgi:hypothetical protein
MLEWESLYVDLLPHPDMFSDEKLTDTKAKKADDDGAKRMFFGGERFLDNISGKAHVIPQNIFLFIFLFQGL